METYENNRYELPNEIKEVPVVETETAPSIMDYVIWMLAPSLLGMVTCGIGTLVLMIIWACDNKNMARANYFRAWFIIMGIGVVIAIVVMMVLLAIGIAVGSMTY